MSYVKQKMKFSIKDFFIFCAVLYQASFLMGLNWCHQNYCYLQRKGFSRGSHTITSMIGLTACRRVGAVKAPCLS